MTYTFTQLQEIRVIVASVLIGVAMTSAAVIAWIMAREPEVPPLRVTLADLEHGARPVPTVPMRVMPGEYVVTHNELDQFARHYQGVTR